MAKNECPDVEREVVNGYAGCVGIAYGHYLWGVLPYRWWRRQVGLHCDYVILDLESLFHALHGERRRPAVRARFIQKTRLPRFGSFQETRLGTSKTRDGFLDAPVVAV